MLLLFLLQTQPVSEPINWTTIIVGLFAFIQAIVIAWFTYNQTTKNKKTDLKIKVMEHEFEEKARKRSNVYGFIYGKMWKQLYSIDCDRLSIIQPHPLNRHQFLTISVEVLRDGILSIKSAIRNIQIDDVPKFKKTLEGQDFIYYKKLKAQADDAYAISLFSTCGCKSVSMKRLVNEDSEWVGNIICEWCREKDLKENYNFLKNQLSETAQDIQYILPEYDEKFKNE